MILQKKRTIFIFIALAINSLCTSQNLLNTSSWKIGQGNVSGFSSNGSAAENVRELGLNHIGKEVVLWKAIPDINNDADGGWDTSYHPIDNSKSYRFSVWIKKTNSYSGTSYFGCQQWTASMDNHGVLRLNDIFDNNPYFWSTHNGKNQLPHLNRWYLLVGFIHHKDYSQTTSQGAIYDGVTGKLIQTISDFKFHSNTTEIRHRAYLYYDTNIDDRQYFYNPRIDVVNEDMETINELLSINVISKLVFSYDNAGNQNQRFYCSIGNCSVPPMGRPNDENSETKDADVKVEELEDNGNGIKVIVSPNPTTGLLSLRLNSFSDISFSHDVTIYNNAGVLVRTVKAGINKEIKIDLSNLSTGLYLVHIHLSNGTSVTKQIIKN